MTVFTAEVVSGNRVTIPKPVREKEDIEEGDFVTLKVVDEEVDE